MADGRLSQIPGPGPELRPLGHASPSRLAALEACFLQAAFGADARYRELTLIGPRARLGSACHALLERVSKGELAATPKGMQRAELERIWGEEVARAEAEARRSPLARHFGPADRWPGHALQRARVMRRAETLLRRGGGAGQGMKGTQRGGAESICAERSYRAYGGRLRGRADLVRSAHGQTEIEDHKTGSIHEGAEPGGAQPLRPRYRKQLLLYAAMHHAETSEWPAKGHVVPLTGERCSIDIDPAEAEREAEAALTLLSRYNDRVSRGFGPESLASPSADACRLCSFKAFCTPFWAHASAGWDWGGSVAVEGLVLRTRTAPMWGCAAEVRVERGNLEAGAYAVRGSRAVQLAEGQRIRAVNLRLQDTEAPTLAVTDYTEIWECPGA